MSNNGAGRQTLAILVGGGPAPGINGVIASATIEAANRGLRVIGLLDGYRWLAQGDTSHVVELGIRDVSRIHNTGGSILGTSRTNPATKPAMLDNTVKALIELGVRYLVCIGGDDTTYGASKLAEHAGGRIGVATVPKTIDNDLPLPENAPTFGFESARAAGTAIIEPLMEDARTTGRWYFAITMGRRSGALALGMCKSAGATLAIIPEEFRAEKLDLQMVSDTLVGAIIKRRASGRDNGVAIIAEGIGERLDAEKMPSIKELERDAYGQVHLSDLPLGALLRERVRASLQELGLDTTVVSKDIGYELRCARPIPFDIEYTRTLGYGAVRYLVKGGSGALIAITGGRITPVALEQLEDKQTGRIRVRTVDVATESYQVARSYMIRLEASDLGGESLTRLASLTHLAPQAFHDRFMPAVLSTVSVPLHDVASANGA
ncbi:MAG TPA: diphosphate--fructose-6-phosphate 1-phosphotransferase, partial [Candidatus Binataceae bacterium]|nr:diphosphate--fructose-6-phosphate 1-phosphotransferase [Candidatus Binataceae bacterium]